MELPTGYRNPCQEFEMHNLRGFSMAFASVLGQIFRGGVSFTWKENQKFRFRSTGGSE
jgi:hypothetical protein